MGQCFHESLNSAKINALTVCQNYNCHVLLLNFHEIIYLSCAILYRYNYVLFHKSSKVAHGLMNGSFLYALIDKPFEAKDIEFHVFQ